MLDIYGDDLERIDPDYDLGTQGETGLDILIYMNEHNIRPRYINIHSDHPTGSREMVKYAEEHFTESVISDVLFISSHPNQRLRAVISKPF